jgi:hypothetical protein
LPRDYIKSGVRSIAEDLCTRQLGYRTQLDTEEARRREVDQYRMTSLDRVIAASNPHLEDGATFLFQPAHLPVAARNQRPFVLARLRTLEKMGLAEPEEADTWQVRSDFLTVLKAMQQTADRQKTLAVHRALISDARLPVVVTEPRKIKTLEGRVLGHGEGEDGRSFGRHHMLLEGTDAQIHLIYYTPELEEARSRGQLGTNSFVEIRKRFADGRTRLQVTNFGDAEKLLESSYFLQRRRRAILISETDNNQPWGGWLGRFHEKLRSATARAERDPAHDFER